MNGILCVAAAMLLLALLIPVAAWLILRRRFANPDFFTFLSFVADYAKNKWRKKPDLWSILRYFQRFLRNIRIKLAFEAHSLAEKSAPVSGDVVSMRALGTRGQFGNQILQYIFLTTYALRHHACAQVPPWVGQLLFNQQDPPPDRELPRIEEGVDVKDLREPLTPAVNIDIAGFFHYPTSYCADQKDFVRSHFRLRPEVADAIRPAVEKLGGRTIVALHMRVSTWDCGHGPFFIAPSAWYLEWLKSFWPTLKNPALFIAADVPEKVLPDFQEYDPYTCDRLGIKVSQADFFGDFFMLTQADALAISNSSFSFTASMLNERGRVFMRPDKELQKLVGYDPWNSVPILLQYC